MSSELRMSVYTFHQLTRPGSPQPLWLLAKGNGPDGNHAIDLLTGEPVTVPFRLPAGWKVTRTDVATAEKAVGLPAGALPRKSADQWPDPWVIARLRSPVFRSVISVLARNPELGYYFVDWRPWITGKATTPGEAKALKSGRVARDPKTTWMNVNGPEQFASSCSHVAAGHPGMTGSQVVLALLRTSYDREAEHFRSGDHWTKPVAIKRSFEQMLRKAGFTARVLAQFDTALARERDQLAATVTQHAYAAPASTDQQQQLLFA